MTPQQCRAARALLGLSRPQLSVLANVGQNTVLYFETSAHRATSKTITKLHRAFNGMSIRFIDDGEGLGVQRMRSPYGVEDMDDEDIASDHVDYSDEVRAPAAFLQVPPDEADETRYANITAEQSRAARAFLNLTQSEAAARARVGLSLIVAYENGTREPRRSNAQKIRQMYEASGIVFTWINGAPAVHAFVPTESRDS